MNLGIAATLSYATRLAICSANDQCMLENECGLCGGPDGERGVDVERMRLATGNGPSPSSSLRSRDPSDKMLS